LSNQFLLAQKLEERSAPERSLSGVCPLAKRMKYIVPVILTVTAMLAGVTIAIINESHNFKGYAWAVPYLAALIFLLLVLAISIVIFNSRAEREKKTEPHTPTTVHQENRQEFNPQFNPQIVIGGSPAVAAELNETAKRIRAFMKSAHPHSAYKADEIATELNLTKSHAQGELKNLATEGWARPIKTDQETLWMFYDPEL
jgi:uncharacterized protein YhhL (DUF1145 family)